MTTRLTPELWLRADPRMPYVLTLSHADGSVSEVTAQEWLAIWAHNQLTGPIPPTILQLFETSLACIAYGYFCYPLFTLGLEQVFRVAESAIAIRSKQLAIPSSKRRFVDRIDWLVEAGHIPTSDRASWHAIRAFRNYASHPSHHTIYSPGQVAAMLGQLSKAISALFTPRAGAA